MAEPHGKRRTVPRAGIAQKFHVRALQTTCASQMTAARAFSRPRRAAAADAEGREPAQTNCRGLSRTYEFVFKNAGLEFVVDRRNGASRLAKMRIAVHH